MAVELTEIQSLMGKFASQVPMPGSTPQALIQKQKTADTLAAAADQATKGISSTGATPALKEIKSDNPAGAALGEEQAAADQEKAQREHQAELVKKDKEIEALQHQLNIEQVHRQQAVSEKAIQDKAKAEGAKIEEQKRQLDEQRRQLEQDKALQDNMNQAELVRHQADMEKETAKQQAAIAQDKAKAMGEIAQQQAQEYVKTTEQGRKSVDKYMADQHKAQQQAFVSPALQNQMNRAISATSKLGHGMPKLASFYPVPGDIPERVKVATQGQPQQQRPTTQQPQQPQQTSTTPSQQSATPQTARPVAATSGQSPTVVNKPMNYGFNTNGMSQFEIDNKAAEMASQNKPAQQNQQVANFTASTQDPNLKNVKWSNDNIVSQDARWTVYEYGGKQYAVPTTQNVQGVTGPNNYLDAYYRGKGVDSETLTPEQIMNNATMYNGKYYFNGYDGTDIQKGFTNEDEFNKYKTDAEKFSNDSYQRNFELGKLYNNRILPHMGTGGVAERQRYLAMMEHQLKDDGIYDDQLNDALLVGNGLVSSEADALKERARAGEKLNPEEQRNLAQYLAQNTRSQELGTGFMQNLMGGGDSKYTSAIDRLRDGTADTGDINSWGSGMGEAAALGSWFLPGPLKALGPMFDAAKGYRTGALSGWRATNMRNAMSGYGLSQRQMRDAMQPYVEDVGDTGSSRALKDTAGSLAGGAVLGGTGRLAGKLIKGRGFMRGLGRMGLSQGSGMGSLYGINKVLGTSTPMPVSEMRNAYDEEYGEVPWYKQASTVDQSKPKTFNERTLNSPQGHNASGDFTQATSWVGVRNPYNDTAIGRTINTIAPFVELATGGTLKLKPSYSPYKSNIPVFDSPQMSYNVVNNTEMDPRLSTIGRFISPIHKNLANQVANANQGGYTDYSQTASSNVFSMPQFTQQ